MATGKPIAPRVEIGHVQLEVADLERALRFYHDVPGFELRQRMGTGAAFVSTGAYHHHIGLNTWKSRGGPRRHRVTRGGRSSGCARDSVAEAPEVAGFEPFGPDRTLTTTRCLLRHPRRGDAEGIIRTAKDPRYPPFDPWSVVTTPEIAARRLDRQVQRWREQKGFHFTIERLTDGAFVGQVSITREPEPHTWLLGYWLHPDAWGRGLGTEVATRVVDFAFERLAAQSIWAGVVPGNEASIRILERLGFAPRGENPAAYELAGHPIATREYELTRAAAGRCDAPPPDPRDSPPPPRGADRT